MPAITYDEDTDYGIDLDESDIAKCADIPTLIGWCEDVDAVMEDIKAQVQICALGGHAERSWVYRAGKAMGYMARARSRCVARLVALGWTPPQAKRDVAELHRKLTEAKARYAVAVEFLRLCEEGGFKDREAFSRLEKKAVSLVDARNTVRAEREAARQAA